MAYFPFHRTRPRDHDNEWRVYDTGSWDFLHGSNFEKVAIDGDTTMLRLAENGTKFTPVTDEAILVSTPTENCVLLCDLLKSKPTCSINDCSKSQNGHVYAMASSENAAKKSYSVWVGGDSGLTKL